MNVPRATYRLQFHERFRLPDALTLVPYLHDLGVSHIYASPLFAACPHSTHGYDVCDFNRLNPELGTENDLKNLVAALRKNGMGLVLDLVPNHMGIGCAENAWWWDVLKNGPASAFAGHFDIDWQLPDSKLRGKILLPVLGEKYEAVLKKNELQIEKQKDEFILRYHEHVFPLAPDSLAKKISAEKINASSAALDQLIQAQNYRLTFFDGDGVILNYRRFFAVNTLAGVRVEAEKVFNDVHALLKRWLAKGWLDGLRVDHPDGLRDPANYLRRLRELAPNQWIVIEKILQADENLPPAWPIDGTTGYDFLNRVNGLMVDAKGETALTDFYRQFTGEPANFSAIVREKKLRALDTLFSGEVQRLVEMLVKISERQGWNFSRENLCAALKEFAADLPVYRTYATEENKKLGAADSEFIDQALNRARRERPNLPPDVFNFFSDLMHRRFTGECENEFLARSQQLTGATMAKGVEDTAFYCFNRFISLNEVGGDPAKFGSNVESFHAACQRQKNDWPNAMLASSTHDTKRSEDVRARLNLLSEIPADWMQTVERWSALNAIHRRGEWPDRNTEYFFYQTLVGAWPLTTGRALACLEKSVREAGQQTAWTHGNSDYENALRQFIVECLRDPQFTRDLERFLAGLTDAAQINSLAQTLVKLTAPGVPDIYQGTELPDFSLVDPDNRRPVDFEWRKLLLAKSKNLSAKKIWTQRAHGLPKLWLIHKTLKLRARKKKWFAGDYEPLPAHGEKSRHVVAFVRGGGALTVVPRLILQMKTWGDTFLELPAGHWCDEFTGEKFAGAVPLFKLLKSFPVALLVKKENV